MENKIESFDLSNGDKKLGVGITIKKQFVSNNLSKRLFVLSSQEPGINGLLDTNQLDGFKVFLDGSNQYELKKDLFCYDLESLQPTKSFEKNENAVSFTSFIKLIKDDDRLASGIRLNGLEKIFWLESGSPQILEAFKRLPLKSNFQKNRK